MESIARLAFIASSSTGQLITEPSHNSREPPWFHGRSLVHDHPPQMDALFHGASLRDVFEHQEAAARAAIDQIAASEMLGGDEFAPCHRSWIALTSLLSNSLRAPSARRRKRPRLT